MSTSEVTAVELAFDEIYAWPESEELGSPILFLHGLFFHRALYKSLCYNLSKQTKRKVFNLDLRNHGESPYTKHISITTMAADLMLFIAQKKLTKVSFVCHSLSSRVATMVALDLPGTVENMIFVDFMPHSADTEKFDLTASFYFLGKNFLQTVKAPSKLAAMQQASNFVSKNFEGEVLQSCLMSVIRATGKGLDVHYDFEPVHEAFNSGRLTESRPEVYNGRVLILIASKSPMFTQEDERLQRKYFPKSKKVTMKGTTHLLLLEKPDEFVEEVEEFLELEESARNSS